MKTILHVSEIQADPDAVFDALTTIEGLSSWWTTRVDGNLEPGGIVNFTFDGGFNPSMRVDESRAPSLVVWTCVAGVNQWADNTFRFELQKRNGGTRLRFRQDYATELSDDEYGSYNYNWGHYLESLRTYVETWAGKPFNAGSYSG